MTEFMEALVPFLKRVWKANDPIEILTGTIDRSESTPKILVNLDGIVTDIFPYITYRTFRTCQRKRKGETVHHSDEYNANPPLLPSTHFHSHANIESAEYENDDIRHGDTVVVLRTQKPVTYILVAKGEWA